jgi:hypothetical protein
MNKILVTGIQLVCAGRLSDPPHPKHLYHMKIKVFSLKETSSTFVVSFRIFPGNYPTGW